MTGASTQTVSVDGRLLRLTNSDKVMYPASGTTKADVISYYAQVAPWLLPHLAGRPVTRKRWVNGTGPGAEVFFE
ncbi:MAG: ATP-dependent DNA ligase, partial [Aeromicrobium sp.]